MKKVLRRALEIGGNTVLLDARIFYQLLDDLVPDNASFIKWIKLNYDADELRGIYDACCLEPEVLEGYLNP